MAEFNEMAGNYKAAEELHLKALAIRREKLGKDHPQVGQSLRSLAQLYRAMARYPDAERMALAAPRQLREEP